MLRPVIARSVSDEAI